MRAGRRSDALASLPHAPSFPLQTCSQLYTTTMTRSLGSAGRVGVIMAVALLASSALLQPAAACDKLRCGVVIAACTATCWCDLPVCECCPECASCMGDLWEECCDCFDLCSGADAHAANGTATKRPGFDV
mmetsp:Transcript_11247/g.39161  ORF Transcript_11247/g.39161 Transcript_11247/m.39161 type:complete len:131 (+) Transcript_11247:164-556(+)